MKNKYKSDRRANFMFLFVLKFSILLMFLFSITANNSVIAQNKNSKDNNIKLEKKEKHIVTDSITGKDQIEEEIYIVADVPPAFPGGENARLKFIGKKLKYPREAKKNKIQGKVFVSFVVEKDGKLTNIKVLKSAHFLLDNEALRMVKLMPKWKPAKIKGKNVRVQCNMPIRFSMSSR
jgi:TonB family protein